MLFNEELGNSNTSFLVKGIRIRFFHDTRVSKYYISSTDFSISFEPKTPFKFINDLVSKILDCRGSGIDPNSVEKLTRYSSKNLEIKDSVIANNIYISYTYISPILEINHLGIILDKRYFDPEKVTEKILKKLAKKK